MLIYECPISHDVPKVPVITNESNTYDFLSIAYSLLRDNPSNDLAFSLNNILDPLTGNPIDSLIYNRAIKKLNDELKGESIPLTMNEMEEVASAYNELITKYPTLKIHGIHSIEGMSAILNASQPPAIIISPQPEFQTDYVNEEGHTALHWAVAMENQTLVLASLAAHVDVNQQDHAGNTALHHAAYKGNDAITALLLNAQADIYLLNIEGCSALDFAVTTESEAIVTRLLTQYSENTSAGGEQISNALCHAATKGHSRILTKLLEANPNINHQDIQGCTALQCAAISGEETIVELLLANQADIYHISSHGYTALDYASESGYETIVTILLTQYIEKGNEGNYQVSQALLYAACAGHEKIITNLLKANADISHPNREGNTALHFAAKNGHKEIIELLLNAKANVHQLNNKGFTATDIAKECKHEEIITLLVTHAKSNPNNANDTDLRIATDTQEANIVNVVFHTCIAINRINADVCIASHPTAPIQNEELTKISLALIAQINVLTGNVCVFFTIHKESELMERLVLNLTPYDEVVYIYKTLELFTCICHLSENIINLFITKNPCFTMPEINLVFPNNYSKFVSLFLNNATIQDYYLNHMIKNPERMQQQLTQDPVFAAELAHHRINLWDKLKNASHLNLEPEEHKKILMTILASRPQSNEIAHPLYTLFKTPPSVSLFSSSILHEIEEYLNTHYVESSAIEKTVLENRYI